MRELASPSSPSTPTSNTGRIPVRATSFAEPSRGLGSTALGVLHERSRHVRVHERASVAADLESLAHDHLVGWGSWSGGGMVVRWC